MKRFLIVLGSGSCRSLSDNGISRLLLLDRGEYVKETKIQGMELYWIDLDRQNDDGGSVVYVSTRIDRLLWYRG